MRNWLEFGYVWDETNICLKILILLNGKLVCEDKEQSKFPERSEKKKEKEKKMSLT